MTAGFPEFTFGGVLLSPFIAQVAVTFTIFLICRPLLRRARIERLVSDPPLVNVCLFIIILAATMLLRH